MFLSETFDKNLKAAFELYNQNIDEYLPLKEQLSSLTFTEAFEGKMQKLISQQKKGYYYLINTVGKRVAVVVLTIILAITSTTLGVRALRKAVINFITETFEKFTTVSTDSTDVDPEIMVKLSPQYIPEGYLQESVIDDSCLYSITYNNKTNNPIVYTQRIQSGTTLNADTEGIEFEKIRINAFEGIAYNKNGFNTVIFADSDYFYSVMGNVSLQELIQMAESIPLEE